MKNKKVLMWCDVGVFIISITSLFFCLFYSVNELILWLASLLAIPAMFSFHSGYAAERNRQNYNGHRAKCLSSWIPF
ncbi:hypothetical protein [Enterovibrio sp. FF113]|uniref:hypothetical protein n=1 Tax=Enterovibrio sp. FF113 TaxID=3230010 RepID=UPI00352FAD64